MAMFHEYAEYDAVGLATLIREGQVSVEEVLQAALQTIDAHNPEINAVVFRAEEYARQMIRDGLPQGPLHGVPFLPKDLGGVWRGLPVTGGSCFFGELMPGADCAYASRLRQAGVLVIGTTNTCELGMSVTTEPVLHGPTRNPWNLEKTAGGSSGGAGAAVAVGMSPVAFGGDAFGSIRAPASCCGVVGLKTSRGLNTLGPSLGEAMAGLVVVGTLTRSIRDQAAFLDISAGSCGGDPYVVVREESYSAVLNQPPGPLKIAVCPDLGRDTLEEADCTAELYETAKLCESLGHHVEEATPDLDLDEVQRLFRLFVSVDTAAMLARHPVTGLAAREDEVEKTTWATAQRGARVTALELVQAQAGMQAIARKMAEFHQRFDIVLTPTLALSPVDLGWLDMMHDDVDLYWDRVAAFAPFCVPFNISGQPAITLPLGMDSDGLPIGIQLAAACGADGLLLRLARQLEVAAAWHKRRPPRFGLA